MQAILDKQKVKEKAVELAFAARTVIQQLASRDRTPEGLEAQEILENALSAAIPDRVSHVEHPSAPGFDATSSKTQAASLPEAA